MSERESNNGRTILDYLNEDCWRAVMEYVPIKDIIRSTEVSRRWQRAVMLYLQSIHISIKCRIKNPHREMILPSEYSTASFRSWMRKIGPSVVDAHCMSPTTNIKIIAEHCPNLKGVTFILISEEQLHKIPIKNFKKLRRLWFDICKVSDDCVSQFIASDVLEDFAVINDYHNITGRCLMNLRSTKLKSLDLGHDSCLRFEHLLSAADRFSELTKLCLSGLKQNIIENIHLLLGKMPKLEYLEIISDEIRCDGFFKTICGLKRLRYLEVEHVVTDKELKAVARCCQELETLDLKSASEVTGCGLAELCELAGPRLARLSLRGSKHLTDNDVVGCIQARPNLEMLDVSGSRALSSAGALAARAAAARRDRRARTPAPAPAAAPAPRTLTLVVRDCFPQDSFDEATEALLDNLDLYKPDGLVVTFKNRIQDKYF